jgi:hypothetical protein
VHWRGKLARLRARDRRRRVVEQARSAGDERRALRLAEIAVGGQPRGQRDVRVVVGRDEPGGAGQLQHRGALPAAHQAPAPRDAAAITTGFLSCYGGKPGTDHLTIHDETGWAIMREQILRYKRDAWPRYGKAPLNYTASNTLGLGMKEYDTYAGEWAFQTEIKPNPGVAQGFYNDFGHTEVDARFFDQMDFLGQLGLLPE